MIWAASVLVVLALLYAAHGLRRRPWWPRSWFDRLPITGFEVRFGIDVSWWWWKPRGGTNFGHPFVAWLCFSIHAKAEHDLPPERAR